MTAADYVPRWCFKVLSTTCFVLIIAVIKIYWDHHRICHQLFLLQKALNHTQMQLENSRPTIEPVQLNQQYPIPAMANYPTEDFGRQKRDVPTPENQHREVVSMLFKGGSPEAFIRDGGLIAPWMLDLNGSSPRLVNESDSFFRLVHGMGAVQVQKKGIYHIYAQVYYLTSLNRNSFSINIAKGPIMPPNLLESSGQEVALCSANASNDPLSSVTPSVAIPQSCTT